MNRRQAWVDIILALILVGVSGVAIGLMGALMAQHQFSLLLILQGVVILLGLRLLLAMRGQSWRHLGLQAITFKDLGRTLVGLFSCIGANMVLTTVIFMIDPPLLKQHMSQLKVIATYLSGEIPFAGIIAMMFFVGVYEEITARGFLLTRCRTALGGRWGPVLLSSFMFGLGHLYQGWIGVAQTTLFGIVLAALTIRWGTLWPAIFAHAILNTFSLVVLERLAEQVP
ncbi:CPBP family intramembrane glutamic endopeptidase [Nitrosococcus wardiae]|uniref:CPBP family intramembrane metalloprotease n=1 Tax=Nitrosococcus wardiae TaxID=1814290 RepID=A0A4P7C4M4_9GAMM|nr:type II CAAX endopeptidase family protein [Nitrosococcus wardiae]QBQ55886.1 CPBP family intramembrane metalloprotease [Nitrosococcus wardiae]